VAGFKNAINLGDSMRYNWWRNNAGVDQLQAYIQATNTTVGTVPGHDILSLSFGGTPGSPSPGSTILTTESFEIAAPSANNVALSLGISATGDRSATMYFGASLAGAGDDANIQRAAGQNGQWQFNQVGTGTTIFSNNGTSVLYLTSSAIYFPTYGQGVLTVGASGQISSTASPTIGTGAGIGTSALTSSFLALAAGTTAKSQINFAASAAPTSPNNGDWWFDGTNLNIQISGATKTITHS
jgi:hypothetical protein